MRRKERGTSTIELLVALSIIAVIVLGAAMTAFQAINVTRRSNDRMMAIIQVQNGGYWISRDAQKAQTIITDNLTPPNFIVINWVERDYINDDIQHSVTYFFSGLSGGVGSLKRSHWSSAGASEELLVAEYIAYDPGDPAGTSNTSYQKPVLAVKLVSQFQGAIESREYMVERRQTFN